MLQMWIIEEKLNGKSYDAISKEYKETNEDNLSRDAIKTCLKRSALSLCWMKGQINGQIPALCDADIEILKDNILEHAVDGQFIDVADAVENAEKLRKERFQKARNFLIRCNCFGLIT